MNKLSLLSYATFCTLAFSCSTINKKEIPVFDLEDLIADTLYLEKDTLTKNIGSNFNYIKNGDHEYLMSVIQHKLLIYSYPEGSLLRHQVYEEEGPNGVGSFISGSYVGDSSVWFLSNNILVEADHFGEINSKYELPEVPQERLAANYSTMAGNRMYKTDEELIIADVPFVLKQPNLDYENWILKLNLTNKNIDFLQFKYPSSYSQYLDDPYLGPYKSTYTPDGVELISLPAFDSLIVISSAETKMVYAGVRDRMEFLPGTTESKGEWIQFNPNYNSSSFDWVDYDPKHQVYIRMVVVTTDTEENKDQGKSPSSKLVVLNRDFEIIAEVLLLEPSNGFRTPYGFYLNIGYPNSEDEVAFARLNFSKIQALL